MAKKADLEADYVRCGALAAEAGRAERDGDYHTTLRRAEASLPHLRGAIGFQRRYQAIDRPPLPTVDQLLRYAPPLFARRSLDALEAWLAEGKRAERDLYPDLPEQLTAARQVMALAARLWSEWHAPAAAVPRMTGPDAAAVEAIARVWVAIGAFAKGLPGAVPYMPVTDMRRDAWGKCPGCGRAHRAGYVTLLEPLRCPGCGRSQPFVITKRAV